MPSSIARSTPASTSSTPPTSTRPASRRRWSARRWRAGASRSCWRRRSAAGWGRGRTRSGLSRLHILEAVEASLTRLGTDYIDLYQIHRFDTLTSLEDTLRALDDLVRAGKVRYIGCSNLAAWQMMKALAISRAEGLERFRCTQSYYSLAGRELEREIDPAAEGSGPGAARLESAGRRVPLGQVHARTAATPPDGARTFDFPPVDKEQRLSRSSTSMRTIAAAHGVSVSQIALAWLLAQRRRDQRHHRRAQAGAARRQPEIGRRGADSRGTADAR